MRIAYALLLVLLIGVPAAAKERTAIAGFVGYNWPVDQDDAASAYSGGLRMRIPTFGHFWFEPGFTYMDMDREPYRVQEVVQTPQEWYIMGATLALTYGKNFGAPRFRAAPVNPYASLGVGYYFLRKREAPDQDRPGAMAQLGIIMTAFPNLSLDLNGAAHLISLDGGGTRLVAGLTLGFAYYFGQY